MNTHSIQSDALIAEIKEQGAELVSLFSKKTKTEYIWQADPRFWNRSAPILFPIVGRLKDDKFTHSGKDYKLPKHGFVRDAPFTPTGPIDSTLGFTYEDTLKTRQVYPFPFILHVVFSLYWNVLETVYHVTNKGHGPMYFSIGSHEAYNCPWAEDEAFEDYYLEFDEDATYNSLQIGPGGLLTKDPAYHVIENGRRLPLNYGLFENDSLVFSDVPSNKVILGSRKSISKVEIAYNDAPNLVLWTKKDAPYICVEPWYGLPDFENSDGQIANKPGIVTLDKGESFSWRHTITIYE